MKITFQIIFMAILPLACLPQKSIDKTLKQLNKNSVEYMYTQELVNSDSLLILDTRKKEEFEVSHIENAVWVGYKTFEAEKILEEFPDKNQPIVVYCSIGVRSEDIGEELQKAGYTQVKNLYGGIFEWKNQENPVVDMNGKETEKVHAYSKFWGRLLNKGEKVY